VQFDVETVPSGEVFDDGVGSGPHCPALRSSKWTT
jgi:hypothetical protein